MGILDTTTRSSRKSDRGSVKAGSNHRTGHSSRQEENHRHPHVRRRMPCYSQLTRRQGRRKLR